jgi:hypothetical protein
MSRDIIEIIMIIIATIIHKPVRKENDIKLKKGTKSVPSISKLSE